MERSEVSQYIRRLYLPFTLRQSNLTAGAPSSTFFYWFESRCSRDFSWSVCFLWFLKKLKCFFTYILYITNAWFAVTLWSVTDRCYKDPTRRVADVKCIKSKSGVNLLCSRRGADVSASTGMAQGERKGSWIDITSHFLGSIWLRGIDISFIDFFILVFEYSF